MERGQKIFMKMRAEMLCEETREFNIVMLIGESVEENLMEVSKIVRDVIRIGMDKLSSSKWVINLMGKV